ncbi:MAG: arginine repressor [Firmicutes bacterium]|nr:arginine repressor [Bacillota bacterium]
MKTRRQSAIRAILSERRVASQQELLRQLSDKGIPATQATVSRDLKELQITRVPVDGGGYRYIQQEDRPYLPSDRAVRAVRDCYASVTPAENLVVLKTLRGSAPAAGEALDSLRWPEIVGTVAGDDTVLIVTSDRQQARAVCDRLKEIGES